jgi:hypothetical protein
MSNLHDFSPTLASTTNTSNVFPLLASGIHGQVMITVSCLQSVQHLLTIKTLLFIKLSFKAHFIPAYLPPTNNTSQPTACHLASSVNTS